jgi:hypothetical protein
MPDWLANIWFRILGQDTLQQRVRNLENVIIHLETELAYLEAELADLEQMEAFREVREWGERIQ